MMDSMQNLWSKILEKLELSYDSDTFSETFKNCQPYEIKNNYLVVVAPTEFLKTRLNKLYIRSIESIIEELEPNEIIKLKFVLANEIKQLPSITSPEPNLTTKYRKSLNANYNFNNYVVGNSNMYAFRMAMKVADQPGAVANPLYIFGSVGLGKTHLMHAIGNYILDNDVNKRILYIKASDFMEDYSKLCQNQLSQDKFNSKYLDLDIILVDDIQGLEIGKKSQLEFFKIFDDLYSTNKQIVITSDRPAKELNIMERLTSRFQVGLTVDIQVPNLEHRINIIKKKMSESGIEQADEEIYSYIASNFTNNIREVEGAILRLITYCEACNLPMNLDSAKEALAVLIGQTNKRPSSTDQYLNVINVICDFYSISYDDITGGKRNGNIVLARQIAMYILKNNYGLAYKKIGSFFGGRDHSTVISSVEKIENEIKNNNDLRLAVTTITQKIS